MMKGSHYRAAQSYVIFSPSLKLQRRFLAGSCQRSAQVHACVLPNAPSKKKPSQLRCRKSRILRPAGPKRTGGEDASQIFHMVGHRIEAAKGLAPHARFGGLLFARDLSMSAKAA